MRKDGTNTMATQQKKTENVKKAPEKVQYPLGKINFILMGICLLMIVVGFWLMTGSANTGDKFNNDLFESSRVTVGPITAFLGFVLMAFAIIWRKKDKTGDDNQQENQE